jgi:hypothetical protein
MIPIIIFGGLILFSAAKTALFPVTQEYRNAAMQKDVTEVENGLYMFQQVVEDIPKTDGWWISCTIGPLILIPILIFVFWNIIDGIRGFFDWMED